VQLDVDPGSGSWCQVVSATIGWNSAIGMRPVGVPLPTAGPTSSRGTSVGTDLGRNWFRERLGLQPIGFNAHWSPKPVGIGLSMPGVESLQPEGVPINQSLQRQAHMCGCIPGQAERLPHRCCSEPPELRSSCRAQLCVAVPRGSAAGAPQGALGFGRGAACVHACCPWRKSCRMTHAVRAACSLHHADGAAGGEDEAQAPGVRSCAAWRGPRASHGARAAQHTPRARSRRAASSWVCGSAPSNSCMRHRGGGWGWGPGLEAAGGLGPRTAAGAWHLEVGGKHVARNSMVAQQTDLLNTLCWCWC
jgi:hypothetical protein